MARLRISDFDNWPVERQILAGFLFALTLLVVMGAMVYRSAQTLSEAHAATQRSQQSLNALEAVRAQLHHAESEQRLYYFTGADADLAPRREALLAVERRLSELENLVGDDPQLRALLPDLQQRVRERLTLLDANLDALRGASPEEIRRRLRTVPGRLEMQRIEEAVARMQDVESKRLRAREREAESDARRATVFVAILLVLSVASVSLLYLRIRREMQDRRQAQESLAYRIQEVRTNETCLRTVLDTVIDAIIVIDERGTIESFNRAGERIFGFTASEVIGKNVSMLMPSPDRERHDGYLARYMAGGAPRIIGIGREVVAMRKDGSLFPMDLAVSEMEVDGRRMFTGLVRDITERKRAEEQRSALIRDLESANEELKNFAYVVSHDLKAPLRAIGSLVDWLYTDYQDRLDDEGKEHLRLLKSRAQRMDRLINGILEYSRVGRIKETPAVVDTNAIVKEALALLAPPENIRVTIEGTLPVVTLEPTRALQLFQNLLSNAIKYMNKPEGQVCISARPAGAMSQFSIADNGPGIEARHHEKIFQLFQTLAPRDRVESTGVGLALVKKIVELYGGRVWLDSAPGKGSTFHFTLPRATTDAHGMERKAL